MIADAGLGDDRPGRIRRQRRQTGRLEIPIARLLEPFEIGAVVGVAERVAFTPAHTMLDREWPLGFDPGLGVLCCALFDHFDAAVSKLGEPASVGKHHARGGSWNMRDRRYDANTVA